jgi:hypothetical protein
VLTTSFGGGATGNLDEILENDSVTTHSPGDLNLREDYIELS